MTIPTVCASRPLRFNHPAIFIHRLPRAWWNISGSHCDILINFSVHAVLHKMSKIPILRQSLYIDCGRSSFRGAAQNWPCRQKSGFSGYLLSMPLAIFMHRLLMIILRNNYFFYWNDGENSVSHTKKRSVVRPSTFLCELMLCFLHSVCPRELS